MASNKDPFDFQGEFLCGSLINLPPLWLLNTYFHSSIFLKLDFEEAENLLERNRDAVTISIEDEDNKPEKQQKKAAGFSPAADDDEDPLTSDDRAEVWGRLICFILSVCHINNQQI